MFLWIQLHDQIHLIQDIILFQLIYLDYLLHIKPYVLYVILIIQVYNFKLLYLSHFYFLFLLLKNLNDNQNHSNSLLLVQVQNLQHSHIIHPILIECILQGLNDLLSQYLYKFLFKIPIILDQLLDYILQFLYQLQCII